MAYESLKASTDAKVYPNNNNEIEATPVNSLLHDYISQLGNFECGGEITPTTLFDFNTELKWWFIAVESGTYTNFDGIILDDDVAIILYEDAVFTKIELINKQITNVADDTTEIGKSLLTNDFVFDTEKSVIYQLLEDAATTDTLSDLTKQVVADGLKLDGIEEGAQVNVNADWDSVSGDSEILNKPTDVTDLSTHTSSELSDGADLIKGGASSTDNELAVFDGVVGKLIKGDSGFVITPFQSTLTGVGTGAQIKLYDAEFTRIFVSLVTSTYNETDILKFGRTTALQHSISSKQDTTGGGTNAIRFNVWNNLDARVKVLDLNVGYGETIGTASFNGNVVVSGNATINGTLTIINSETLQVKDKNIELAVVTTPTDDTADGGGITLLGATNKTITWVKSKLAWVFNQAVEIAGDLNLVGGIFKIDGTQIATSDLSDGTDLVKGGSTSTANEISTYTGTTGKAITTSAKIIVSNQTDLKTALALTTPYKIEVTKDLSVTGTVTIGAFHIVKGSILTFADGIIFSSTSVTGAVIDTNCNFLGDAVYTSDYNTTLNIRLLTGNPTFTKTTTGELNLKINSVESSSSVTSTAGTLTLDDENYWGLSGGGGHEIYTQTSETVLEQRDKMRFKGFLKASDNAVTEETEVDVNTTSALSEDDFQEALNITYLKLAENKMYFGSSTSLATQTFFYTVLASYISSRFDVSSEQLRLLCTNGKILGGGSTGVVEEKSTFEMFNVIFATATANGELSFTDIDDNAYTVSNAAIDLIMVESDAAVTFNLGTTALGTDIVSAEAIDGRECVDSLIRCVNGSIYISSADWNAATIQVQIHIRKAWVS